jgi:pSer/pThr/pTyr-binding forkhead associated (FHA) protein
MTPVEELIPVSASLRAPVNPLPIMVSHQNNAEPTIDGNGDFKAPEATLHILLRDGSVVERDLNKAETRLGKGPQNDIILADASVSGAHAMISFADGRFTLSDLGSRNGTLLNEARVSEPRPLHHGDLIKMGHCAITFRLKEAETTLSIPRTALLDPNAPPPPPTPPPAPKTPAPTEDAMADALVAASLVAQSEIDRLRGPDAKGRRLYRALLEEKLASEIGLRDLMSRTFNLTPVELKSMEVDVASAAALRAQFLRDRLICPVVSQQPDKLMLVVADPTDKGAIEEAERVTRKKASLRLALPSEIKAQLDAFFTPRLIGVMPTGEKVEAVLNHSEVEIGKAAHNRLVLNDATVSSTHAIIIARDGGFNIADLGSSNGTFINGRQLGKEAHALQHGDKIQLGQVLLTFRNPAETTENKTARLSPEALEEIRRRAMTRTLQAPPIVKTDPGSWAPVAPPQPAIIQQAAASADEKSEKKKKKEKDKNSWSSASSLSRIVAQVMGALVSLVGTILVVKFGLQQQQPGKPVETTAGNASAVVRFASSAEWNTFSTGFFSRDVIEASGVQAVAGSNGVLMAEDSRESEVLWMQLDETGKQTGSIKSIPLGVRFKDPEAITFGNGFYYLVTSQADPRDGAGNALVRFAFDPQTQTVKGQAEIINDFRSFLLANISDNSLKVAAEAPGMQGGLNLEGIAWDPNEGRLLLGLRSPQLGKNAALVPVRLRDPQSAFAADNLQVETPIYLSLGGQGVRDITYDPKLRTFLIVSGMPETEQKTDFGVWEWNGLDTNATRLMTLDEKMKPEGITSFKFNDLNFVFIVGDAGSYLKLDYAGK